VAGRGRKTQIAIREGSQSGERLAREENGDRGDLEDPK